jgi:hypothetical protein
MNETNSGGAVGSSPTALTAIGFDQARGGGKSLIFPETD